MSTWVIIPCVAEKATEPCFASQLYTARQAYEAFKAQ
jgi:hypothetical protein